MTKRRISGRQLSDTTGDFAVDWQEIAAIIEDAYRIVAPKSLLATLDNKEPVARPSGPRVQSTIYPFAAELWRHHGEGSWHFVTLPQQQADEIMELASSLRRGFGSIRVIATVGASTWHTSIFPDTKRASFVLPIKKQVRTVERLKAGDQIQISVEIAGL
jgi:uncharacterized protein DUF1905